MCMYASRLIDFAFLLLYTVFAENSPPLPQYRPKPRPRTPKTINKHKSFFITNLPLNTKEPTLRNYLEVLTGSIMCTEIKLKTPKAAVVFSEAVGMFDTDIYIYILMIMYIIIMMIII